VNNIAQTIRHHILRLFHLKKVKSLTHSLISKYIQSLKFKNKKTEIQILASLSSLKLDKILHFNENFDTYSLLIDRKDLENKISNKPEEYKADPELLKFRRFTF